MKIFKLSIMVALLSFTLLAAAHPEHDRKPAAIEQQQAIDIATSKLDQLVEREAVDKSWRGVESNTADLKRIDGRKTWVVEFAQSDGKVLVVRLTNTGHFLSFDEQ